MKETAPWPRARAFHSVAYDSRLKRIILFGGITRESAESEAVVLQDTWAYDVSSATWRELNPEGPVPAARSGHHMVYDPDREKIILFGGTTEVDGLWTRLQETWLYDPAQNLWTNANPGGSVPPSAEGQAMVYDPELRRAVLLGALEDGARYTTTGMWSYDAVSNEWSAIEPQGARPSVRFMPAASYDSSSSRILLFGGRRLDGALGEVLSDIWSVDAGENTWTDLRPAGSLPSQSYAHSAAYDERTQTMVVYEGWVSATGFTSETWAYDPRSNRWTNLQPPSSPPGERLGESLIADPDTGCIVLFAGAQWRDSGTALAGAPPTTYFRDVWVYVSAGSGSRASGGGSQPVAPLDIPASRDSS